MTQQQYIIQRKLNVIDLAQTLGNISEACRRLSVSRQHYYDIKTALKEDGIQGLLEKTRKRRADSRIPTEFESQVLDYCLHFPVHGQVRVANELRKSGVSLSPSTVHSIWKKNDFEKIPMLRLESLQIVYITFIKRQTGLSAKVHSAPVNINSNDLVRAP